MLPSFSILQQIGLVVLLVATVVWVVGLVLLAGPTRGRKRPGAAQRSGRPQPRGSGAPLLGAVPRQTGPAGPPSESVELSAAEREAFAGLVRQLTGGS